MEAFSFYIIILFLDRIGGNEEALVEIMKIKIKYKWN